jgi:hypothetical protein
LQKKLVKNQRYDILSFILGTMVKYMVQNQCSYISVENIHKYIVLWNKLVPTSEFFFNMIHKIVLKGTLNCFEEVNFNNLALHCFNSPIGLCLDATKTFMTKDIVQISFFQNLQTFSKMWKFLNKRNICVKFWKNIHHIWTLILIW